MLIGYARVSTNEQNLDLQTDSLSKLGCEKIFTDICSGANDSRPGLIEALQFIRSGDTLVVWKLDRLSRSLKHLIELINEFSSKDIGFKSLNESIDTSSAGGKLVFHIFSALAEFEKELIRTRTRAGLNSARIRGRIGGRPKKISPTIAMAAKELSDNTSLSISEICSRLNISRSSYYRALLS